MTTISTVGSLVNTSVTASQSTVSVTTVNAGDVIVAAWTVYGNIQITAVSSSHATWVEASGPLYNATIGATTHLWLGTVTSAATANVTLTFSGTIGTTKVQNTIRQLTAGLGAACEWHYGATSQTNASASTMAYPSLPATCAEVSYFPYAVNGTQATATGICPFAYVGYGVATPVGSAGSTSGFTYTVDANSAVLLYDLGLTQNSTYTPSANLASSAVSITTGAVLMPYVAGTPFLTQAQSGLRIAVEVAWGANQADLTAASWDWTDITQDMLMDPTKAPGAVRIQLGSPNDTPGQQTQASQMTLTVLNSAGQYSLGGQSPNYPNVIRNTPIRCRIYASGWAVKYQGGVVSFEPAWDHTGKWATVMLTASGPLRRINQGSLKSLSVIRQFIQADSTVVGYWPLEDGQNTTSPVEVTGNGTSSGFNTYNYSTQTEVTGVPGDCASYSGIVASAPVVTLKDGGNFQGHLTATYSSSVTVSVIIGNLDSVTPNQVYDASTGTYKTSTNQQTHFQNTGALMTVFTGNAASYKCWEISWVGQGILNLQAYSTITHTWGSSAYNGGNFTYPILANTPHELALTLSQSGSTTTWTMSTMPLVPGASWNYASGSTTQTATNATAVTAVALGEYSDLNGIAFGHCVVRSPQWTLGSDLTTLLGQYGESVTARLSRLCTNLQTPFQVVTSSIAETSTNPADTMGTQQIDTFANLIRECEATGQGVVLDGLGPGLTYLTRQYRISQQPQVTLDANVGNISVFDPVDDDQNACNDVLVTRRNGSSYEYQMTSGPRGISTIGVYQNSFTINQTDDSGLAHTAQWTVNTSTAPGYRYQKIDIALEFNPSVIASWVAMPPFSRVDIINITDIRTQIQNATIKCLVLGWTETIDLFTWRVEANCASYDPYRVITLAAATGSTNDTTCWLDTDGSQLASSAAQGATSISVTVTSGPRWVTTADTGGSDNFPFSINLGGYQVQVTNVTGTSNPQTFTVSALPQAFPAGTAITIWDPPVLGM